MATYRCKNCNSEWNFFAKDYNYKKSTYPTGCPLCEMPILNAFNDIRKEEGLLEALRFVIKFRILKWK